MTEKTNNIMRHNYESLSGEQQHNMTCVKDLGLELVTLFHEIGGTLEENEETTEDTRQATRELSLAQTKVEEAVMWAVKHITKGDDDGSEYRKSARKQIRKAWTRKPDIDSEDN